eukprot:m.58739 g.58739  ORF g.58739 m.58739 type:complete len:410 (+) comp11280_c0_seq4:86-1315(+)
MSCSIIYRWADERDFVSFSFYVPKETKLTDIVVEFTDTSIFCTYGVDLVISGQFYQPVKGPLCQWKMKRGGAREHCEVRIKVPKRVSISWPYPILGDASDEIVCDPQSHFLLGLFYEKENDMDTAVEHWQKAAQKKHTEASFFLGKLCLLNRREPKVAASLLKTAALSGHCEAMYTLGEAHQMGLFSVSSLKQALAWYEKCVEPETLRLYLSRLCVDTYPPFVINAHYNAAMIYLNPSNKDLYDAPMGVKLLKVAAKSGNAHALYRLGKILLDGKILERNLERACAYIQEAIDLNPSIKIPNKTRKILELVNAKKRNVSRDRVSASHPSPLRRNNKTINNSSAFNDEPFDDVGDDDDEDEDEDDFRGFSINTADHTPIPTQETASFWKNALVGAGLVVAALLMAHKYTQ